MDVHVGEEELSGLTKALYGASSERYGIDAARRHIREKLEINPAEPRYLKVVWGQGYKCEKKF